MDKNFFIKLRALADFVIGFGLGYLAFSFPFYNPIFNIILIVVSIFVLLQGLGNIDIINGYGQHDNKDHPNNEHHRP